MGTNLVRIVRISCLSLLLMCSQLLALESPKITITPEFLNAQESIGNFMRIASDERAEMDVASIMAGNFDKRFEAHKGKKVISFGFNRQWPHWAFFTLESLAEERQKLFLEVGYSALDKITLYKTTPNGEILSTQILGDRLPFSERPIQYRHPIFDLELDPGLNYFLAKVETTSGVTFDFKIYNDSGLKNTKLKELITVGFLLGGIITIFFYNLFLFLTTGDRNYGLYIIYVASYFFFALSYFGIAPYFFFSDWEAAPLTSWDLYITIDFISIGAILFTIGFLDLKKRSPTFFWILSISGGAAFANVLSNLLFLHGSIPQLQSITVLMSFVVGAILVMAGFWITIKGYGPAIYFTIAWTFVIGGNSLVILSTSGIIEHSFLTTWGQLIGANAEMIFLSFALGARINLIKRQKLHAERRMLKEAEEKKKLQEELIATQEENIRTLDAKVKERTRDIREILTHINQGIFTFKEDMKLGPEYSDHLVDILGKEELAESNVFEALFSQASISANHISQTVTALEFSFGEDKEFGWEANKDSLIREFEIIDQDNKRKFVEIDWGAIENDNGELEKVLVALRDVTEVKELKARAEAKEQEAAMLLEMLSNDIDKTKRFLERTLDSWRDIEHGISRFPQDHKEAYNSLFRTYHTIKGNARSLGFNKISDYVHDVESLLKDLWTSYNPEKFENFCLMSDKCHQLIESYHQIFMEKFSRFFTTSTATVEGRLFEVFFEETIFPSISKIARDVGKAVPAVNINNPDGLLILNDEIEDVTLNILNHLIRNSLDHGIESTEERKALGKKPYGEITIDISIDSDKNARILYRDDGRGLNMSKIYRLGLKKGILTDAATEKDLIEVIFHVGFSTAAKTTHISGRGIGMDAVRHYSQSIGADFIVKLDKPIDELTLKRIKSDIEDDIYATFSFQASANLRVGGLQEKSSTSKVG